MPRIADKFDVRVLFAALFLALGLSALLPARSLAQAGPSFRADDPRKLERHHLQVNLGISGDRDSAGSTYQSPIMDVNYALNSRTQLKYVLPLTVTQTNTLAVRRPEPIETNNVVAGIGENLAGAKLRFYQHHAGDEWFRRGAGEGMAFAGGSRTGATNSSERGTDLSLSIFPRLTFNSTTHNASRSVLRPGPTLLLPLDVSTHTGPWRVDGEAGYYLVAVNVPRSWIMGVVVSRKLGPQTRIGVELDNQQETSRSDAIAGRRQTTAAVGGQQALNKRGTISLTLLGGRILQNSSSTGIQPGWFAYAGVRFVLWPRKSPPLELAQN